MLHLLLRISVLIALWATVFGLTSLYVVRRSVKLAPRLAPHKPWLWAVSALCLAMPMALYALWSVPGLWRALGLPFWVAHFLFGLYMTFFLYLATADVSWALARRVRRLPAEWGETIWVTTVAVSVVSALAGLVQVLLPVPLERVEVRIHGLPPAFEGFRVVQLSDLHVGSPARRAFVERIVRRANTLNADAIVLTGDTVHAPEGLAGKDVEALGALRARHGTFAITGNHETDPALPELSRLGITVLANDHVPIVHDGERLWLVGLSGLVPSLAHDATRDVEAALAGVPEEAVKILLVHDPGHAPRASLPCFQLLLSGHTHGGQFFPWSLVFELLTPYPPGLHRVGETWLYVSRGTGWWGPPNRFLVPPEMTALTLRAE